MGDLVPAAVGAWVDRDADRLGGCCQELCRESDRGCRRLALAVAAPEVSQPLVLPRSAHPIGAGEPQAAGLGAQRWAVQEPA